MRNRRYVVTRPARALVRGADVPLEEAAAALAEELQACDAVVVGAGAGLSASAGLRYSGARFDENFSDFRDAFGIQDMYSGGFYPFPDLETYWAWWSRHILLNRYEPKAGRPYVGLRALLDGKDCFVITTNVDHQFHKAGFDESRLFCTQGDYGRFECSRGCACETYDNEQAVREMAARQRDMRVPAELVPMCPRCGAPLRPHLRVDDGFCEPREWHEASARYREFRESHETGRVLYLELGVGGNTPSIIKYPFWEAVAANPDGTYVSVNLGDACAPACLSARSILLDCDIGKVLEAVARIP